MYIPSFVSIDFTHVKPGVHLQILSDCNFLGHYTLFYVFNASEVVHT